MTTLLSLLLPLCLLAGGSMAAATCDVVTTDPDIPSEPAFYLLKDNENTTELCEGSTVHMCLAIHLPQGDTILNVEMFTPDNDTTLMVVCDPKVTSVGSNLAGVTTSFLPTLDAKDSTTNYDHGVLNLGTVTNTGTDTSSATPSLLVVEWDAVMLKTSRSDVDGNVFWVSAGSEIINQTTNESSTIWVGQHSFVLNSSCNFTVADTPQVNMTGTDTMEVGTSASFNIDVYLPDATSDVIVDVIIPTNGSGILSVCSIVLTTLGNNYKCFGKDSLTHTVTASSSGRGNDRAQLVTGTMTNAYTQDTTKSFADKVVTFQFTIYLYENSTIGVVYLIGAAVRIGNDAIWAGMINVETTATTPSGNMTGTPTFSLTNQGASTLGVGQGTTLRLEMSPPANEEGDYIMEILMPMNDTARMEVCLVKVVYIGLNMACVIESEPVYSSRAGINSTYDKVYWNLGKIKNHGYRTDSNSMLIRIEIVIKLANHSLNLDWEKVIASIGVQFSVSRIWVSQHEFIINTNETTTDQPTFTLAHAFGTGGVQVGASTYVIMEMTVPPGAVLLPMDVEFLMPTYQNDTALFSLCRMELYYVGSNLPCLNQTTANASITYVTGEDGKNYRGVVSLGGINNVAVNGTNVSSADVIRFGMSVRVEDHFALVNGSMYYVAVGVMYTVARLWVGQLQVVALTDDQNLPQSGSVYAELDNSTLVANQGATVVSNMYIKIPSQSTFKVAVSVSACSEMSICALYVAEAGTNLPCVISPLSGNVTWDTTKTLGESALLDMGYVTNIHLNETVETNATFDNNTIRVSLVGRLLTTATIGSSCAVTWKVSVDGVETAYAQTVDVQAAATSINVSDTLPTFSYYLAALDDNATEPTGEMHPGESVLVRLDITPNNYVSNELTVRFMAPANDSQPMEVCAANVVHAGANVPCLQRGGITATMSSRNNDGVNDVATLGLGSICSYPLKSDNHSQVVTLEAVIRLRPKAQLDSEGKFWFSITVNVDSTVIYVGQLLITPGNFTDKGSNYTDLAVPPSVTMDNVAPGPINMSPASEHDLSYIVTFPPNKTVQAAMDISLPYNESACFTVVSFNVTGVGANLGCGSVSASTYTNVTYTSTNSTSQNDGAYLDLGVMTNSGVTYRTESAVDSDNQLNVTIRIKMADCVLNDNLAELWPSFAAKVGSMIAIIDKAVSVVRTGAETPDLLLTSDLNDPTQTYSNGDSIEAGGCLKHTETSTAEGRDVKVNYYLPPYLTFGGLTSSNGTTPTVVALSGATGVSLTWADVFFTDHLCFNFTLSVDMTGSASNPPSGPTPRATSPYQASCTMRSRVSSSYTDGTLFYSLMSSLPVNVTGGCSKGCSTTVTLVKDLKDCQVSSTSPRATVSDIRTDTAAYWTPIVRCSGYPVFLQLNLGNLTRITQVSVVQDTSLGYSYITQYRLKYKNHENTWTTGELVTGVTDNHNQVLSCPVEARYLRLEMVSVHSPNERLGLRVEVHGCSASSDTTADFCAGTDTSRPTIPSLEVQPELMVRTFLVITGDIAFVCDINPFKTSWMYPDGEYVCFKTQGCTNNQWTPLDSQVMNILGFDSNDNALYGIARYQRNFVMSKDYAATWYSIPASMYNLAKAEATFTRSWDVQMSPEVGFSATYQFANGWKAKFDGLYCNTNTKILDWCFV